MTASRRGVMIRVYRIDALEEQIGDRFEPFQVPILVDYYGHGESIADILEERDTLRADRSKYMDKYHEVRDQLAMIKNPPIRVKKWYKFWK